MPCIMEYQSKISCGRVEGSNIISRNSRITKLLEVILEQRATSKVLHALLLKFWSEVKNYISEDEEYSTFDALFLYILDYAFEQNDLTLSVVSKAVYSHTKRNLLTLDFLNFRRDFFIETVRNFTNFSSKEGKEVLLFALIECLSAGNIRLSKVLIKFGLVDFPSSVTMKERKILENLMFSYADCNYSRIFGHPPEEHAVSFEIDEMLNRMVKNKELVFRRCIFVLTVICIASEYETNEYNEILNNSAQPLELRASMERHAKLCLNRKICLNLFIAMSSETFITLTDINKFFATVMNPQIKEAHRMSLLERCREIFPDMHDNYSPRTLKDLARSRVRECFRHTVMLTKDVDELPLPPALKEFIIFGKMRKVEGS